MSQTLTQVAGQLYSNLDLVDNPIKVELIYAFNGSGKTRLSRAFKEFVLPETLGATEFSEEEDTASSKPKILYYNAFTEDLFTWVNDQDEYIDHKFTIRSNGLTEWLLPLLRAQGMDGNITSYFQDYTNTKITPVFNEDYSEIRFNLALGGDNLGNENNVLNLKISKGEESNFVWSVFHSMLDLAVSVLSEPDPTNRETADFDNLEYVFIDDPVSSLDDNHLIHTAVSLAKLVKKGGDNLKFIISTHNPLFFNVLSNEFENDKWDKDNNDQRYWKKNRFKKRQLKLLEDGLFDLSDQPNDSPFSYQIHIKNMIKKAIDEDGVEKYHFNLMRNLLEKTATFLGHNRWEALLPKNSENQPDEQCMRALNVYSHSKQSGDEVSSPTQSQIEKLAESYHHLINEYRFYDEVTQSATT